MIILYVVGGWLVVGAVAAVLFSLWHRLCGHRDPVEAGGAERTADKLRPDERPSVTRAARAAWP